MANNSTQNGVDALSDEVRELRESVEKAYDAFRLNNQVRRTLAMSFLKGVTSAIGALVAVVIVTPLVIWTIQQIAWPPIIAGIVSKVILQYDQVNHQTIQAPDGQ